VGAQVVAGYIYVNTGSTDSSGTLNQFAKFLKKSIGCSFRFSIDFAQDSNSQPIFSDNFPSGISARLINCEIFSKAWSSAM